jgi:hypothetical protein
MAITLIPGQSYRLTSDTRIGRCEFREDEVVTFSSGGYSPYDDCYVYHFVSSVGDKNMCTSQSALAESELERFEPTS